MKHTSTWEILSCKENSFEPLSVKRLRDKQVFTVGDYVTNGTQMQGKITGWSLHEGTLFVSHTWSGIGMGLDSLEHCAKGETLPSAWQMEDSVTLTFSPIDPLVAIVKGVHFYKGKVKYDLELLLDDSTTRIYNVDSIYLTPFIERS